MMTNPTTMNATTPRTEAMDFRLETLELLPCGCVVAIQRVAQSGVRLISLEAKGPHCLFHEHRPNKVMRLGEMPESDEDYDDEAIRVA